MVLSEAMNDSQIKSERHGECSKDAMAPFQISNPKCC